jgi:hypothetical protein
MRPCLLTLASMAAVLNAMPATAQPVVQMNWPALAACQNPRLGPRE